MKVWDVGHGLPCFDKKEQIVVCLLLFCGVWCMLKKNVFKKKKKSQRPSFSSVWFSGAPEGGSLQWQVLGVHVWAWRPSNVPLSLSASPPSLHLLDGDASLLNLLLLPLDELLSSPHSLLFICTPSLVLYPHHYGNQPAEAPTYFFSIRIRGQRQEPQTGSHQFGVFFLALSPSSRKRFLVLFLSSSSLPPHLLLRFLTIFLDVFLVVAKVNTSCSREGVIFIGS